MRSVRKNKRSRHGTARLLARRRMRPGAAPGTLVADPQAGGTTIRVIGYGPEGCHETGLVEDLAQIAAVRARWAITWVDVTGLGDLNAVRRIAEEFGLHPLELEDIVHTHQRPKIERYAEHYFIVARQLAVGSGWESEQLSLLLGRDFVLTFQEREGDCLDPVRERIRREGTRLRTSGADYLAYAIVDAVVDHYFPVLDQLGERLDALEERALSHPGRDAVGQIQEVRHGLLAVRRAIWPLREEVASLLREPTGAITQETAVYFRDTYDHIVQLIELVEIFREIATGLMELQFSGMAQRTNETMRVLTIIATIFIPLSFIASVYGMNFDRETSRWNMPELGWSLGYPFALGLMLAVALGLLAFFRRKGWLGGGDSGSRGSGSNGGG